MKSYFSLKYKLFLILACLSLIPISLVSYSSRHFLFRSSMEYSSSISSQYVRFVSHDISLYLKDLSQSFDALLTHSAFQKFLETPDDNLVEKADYLIAFRPVLRNALQSRNEIVGVLYLDELGKTYFESARKGFRYGFDFRRDPLYASFFGKRKEELSVPHTMDYIIGSPETVFSFVRPIYNLRTGEVRSWLIVEIREEKLKSMLSVPGYDYEGHLLLYHSGTGTAVSEVPNPPDVLECFRQSLGIRSGDNRILFTSGGIRYEAAYADIPYGDWKLVWLAPLSSMTRGVRQSSGWTLFIAVVSLAAALIIAFPVMKGVLRPLYKLKDGMHSLGRGTYVPIPPPYGNDEFGFLIRSYNQMLHELQRMEQEVYQTKIREKERELLQLQAQINPHFLFNTLETIESYAVKNNGEAVGEMVQLVARMMRYNVRNDGGWAPLKEEIAYIQNFLKIHYYRNGMDVGARFEIDSAALELPIMKLSIQPFVENSIKHGWSPHLDPREFLLTVKAEIARKAVSEAELHICIIDTGAGMAPHVLDKIREMITAEGEGEIKDPYFQRHTGIYNVFRRFRLAYGDKVYFSISSTPGEGTCVEIRVPVLVRS
ncbi:MAG: two-component sensor histidine kinase [Candidatus Reconcilbacillus cellulovorans]|uniref:Two-component sensor histidine kinase n=1 Tax=Candidatus Reconcilbacillus cellulovorans TaxID=1906605 RepID=A0A2A6E2K6_9BACL|nr:MAG: two-component sensor histidine kinase [Candidatus Reconcilbacillus cellulovorans]